MRFEWIKHKPYRTSLDTLEQGVWLAHPVADHSARRFYFWIPHVWKSGKKALNVQCGNVSLISLKLDFWQTLEKASQHHHHSCNVFLGCELQTTPTSLGFSTAVLIPWTGFCGLPLTPWNGLRLPADFPSAKPCSVLGFLECR